MKQKIAYERYRNKLGNRGEDAQSRIDFVLNNVDWSKQPSIHDEKSSEWFKN